MGMLHQAWNLIATCISSGLLSRPSTGATLQHNEKGQQTLVDAH